jgi:hypothetical protein
MVSVHGLLGAPILRWVMGSGNRETPSLVSDKMIQGYSYTSKPDHRDGTPEKSQWYIGLNDEFTSFDKCVSEKWIRGQMGWGLHIVDDEACNVGISAANHGPPRDLFMIFFSIAPTCHGYPSDPQRSRREMPPDDIRAAWLTKQYLRRSVVRKLGRGQPCKL